MYDRMEVEFACVAQRPWKWNSRASRSDNESGTRVRRAATAEISPALQRWESGP